MRDLIIFVIMVLAWAAMLLIDDLSTFGLMSLAWGTMALILVCWLLMKADYDKMSPEQRVAWRERFCLRCRRGGISTVVVFTIISIISLPFHYVLVSGIDIFPKEHLTFSNTVIDQSDIDRIIDRYNAASLFERVAITQEPLVRELRERGYITRSGE
jgi:hypothetical protein